MVLWSQRDQANAPPRGLDPFETIRFAAVLPGLPLARSWRTKVVTPALEIFVIRPGPDGLARITARCLGKGARRS
jgi:hypothetical protein